MPHRDDRVERALGGEPGRLGLIATVALALALGALTALALARVAGAIVAGLGVLLARHAAVRLARRRAARERAGLEAWWPTLDVGGYLAYLAGEHAGGEIVQVTVCPRRDADPAIRARIVRATRAAEARATWSAGALILTSPPLAAGDGRAIHAWFRRVERGVLRPLARHAPLASIRVGGAGAQ